MTWTLALGLTLTLNLKLNLASNSPKRAPKTQRIPTHPDPSQLRWVDRDSPTLAEFSDVVHEWSPSEWCNQLLKVEKKEVSHCYT